MPNRTLATLHVGLLSVFAWLHPVFAGHSLVDRVKDGPTALTIRESYRLLELGEASKDDDAKLALYGRGKALAELALKEDDHNAEAHFALFANWGRMLQTDGWLKNSFHLPALWRELNRTLELNPEHPDALAAKGGLYLELPRFLGGDADKAQDLLERAVVLDGDSVGARLELAECYIQNDRGGEARELAATAMRIAVEQGKIHFVRRAGTLLQELGPPPHTEAKR